MPDLKEVVMKGDGFRGHNNAAAILSSSRHGWRSVTIEYWSLDDAAKMSLENHFSTLQMLDVSQCGSFTGDDLVKILSSYPTTGLLKAWACEPSLRVLDIKITGIPRPDLKTGGEEDHFIVEEDYYGQGREIQELVYGRLARPTHLETILLTAVSVHDVLSCPEFTLESGLHKIAGLKLLERLDVCCMEVKLELEEVQWMAEHWPSLRLLHADVVDLEGTRKWLKEHRPLISLKKD
ncbi:MAG: hypothetical protein J3Q66DRAFT_350566 [Benniella sp.]|nr:MAG: hypothetical protein J3Q66DRAFT_350566 [Benniella sp.]